MRASLATVRCKHNAPTGWPIPVKLV